MSVASRPAASPNAVAAATAQRLPDPLVRTIVSLLLFVHLFALGIAVLSNGAPEASPLASQLRMLIAHLQLLDMDLNYRFHLTYGEVLDVDHTLEIEMPGADGENEVVVLPEPNVSPGVRLERYQKLGLAVAARVGDQQNESLLPQAVAAAVMRRHDAKKATFRCRGHFLLTTDDALSPDPTVADPFDARRYRVVYEAEVVRGEGNAVNLMKTSDDEAIFGGSSSTPRETAPPPSTSGSSP